MQKFAKRVLHKVQQLDKQQTQLLARSLLNRNQELSEVIDSIHDGIVVTDKNHMITLLNKAAERLLAFRSKRMLHSAKIWDCIVDLDVAVFVEEILAGNESVLGRDFFIERNGETQILNCSIIPLLHNQRISGNIMKLQDVTEQRRTEVQLKQAERLASLTTLAAGVAHEIKNPLGSIGIHTQLIQKAIDTEHLQKEHVITKNIRVINEEIERLNKIIVDFLFAVRPVHIQPENSDMNKLITEFLEFIQYELQNAGIETICDLQDDIPILSLDTRYFKQALLNIVQNAVAAMPHGGKLYVKTQVYQENVRLIVRDTGHGISEEILGKIFEPYFTTRDNGTGLGLTQVYKIIQEHKGDITMQSQTGKGSTCIITIPIPQGEQRLLRDKE